MDLERLENINQQQMIRSIFKRKLFKQEFKIRKQLDLNLDNRRHNYIYSIDKIVKNTNEDERIFECNLPFKLEVKSKFNIDGIGKVEIKYVEFNSDGSIEYTIEDKICNEDEQCPKWIEEIVKDLNSNIPNKIDLREYMKYVDKYMRVEDDIFRSIKRLEVYIRKINNMSMMERLFLIKDVAKELMEIKTILEICSKQM